MTSRILVVDERREMHALVRLLLRRDGVTVLSAFDANEAMSIAVAHAADVVVLDLDRLGIDGCEMCEQLEADPRTRDIATVFVTRPIDPEELHARVRTALRDKRERDALLADTELDPSTGVANARAFERHLAARITAHHALGEQAALVFIEVDRREIAAEEHLNETAVQTTAAVLAASIRSSDALFRIGEAKFAILLVGANVEGAQCVVERLRRRLSSVDMEHERSSLKITARFGVTATSRIRGRVSSGEMKNAADDALQAHRVGRDCIVTDAIRIRAS